MPIAAHGRPRMPLARLGDAAALLADGSGSPSWCCAALILVVFPLTMSAFRLNLVGKYLTYAFVALGLVICWGHGGILSLGQGVFFGLGGYCMAMFLKLEASDPVSTAIQSTPGHPGLHGLEPAHGAARASGCRSRVCSSRCSPCRWCPACWRWSSGWRCSSAAWAACTSPSSPRPSPPSSTILIIGQQGYTGGVNGITDLKTLQGWDIRTDSAQAASSTT